MALQNLDKENIVEIVSLFFSNYEKYAKLNAQFFAEIEYYAHIWEDYPKILNEDYCVI